MKTLIASAFVAVIGTGAYAANYNFIDAIDNGPIGEAIFSSYDTSAHFAGPSLSLTGTQNGNEAYAYFDYNKAGVGVCGSPRYADNVGDVFDERTTGSLARGENQCSSASDDSIQSAVNEVLKITSNEDNVLLTSITLNANHDGNLKDGDKVKVDGVEYDVTGLLTTIGTKTYFTLTLNKMLGIGDMVTVESVNRPHLYMSSMEAATVPIPAAGLLLLGGLAGLGAVRKLRKPA